MKQWAFGIIGDIECLFSTSWCDSLDLHEMSAK